jgi:hypothetical protein
MSNAEMAGMMTRCMMMCRDCADMCMMASCMMSRGSEYAKQMCKCVLMYATRVQWNAKNMHQKWKNVRCVLMLAVHVQKNAGI